MRGRFVVALSLFLAIDGFAEAHLFGIKIAVTNPAAVSLRSERIRIDRLRKIAPGLHPGSLIITITNAATELQDTKTVEAQELAYQVNNLKDDTKAEELSFKVDLDASATRIVTVSMATLSGSLISVNNSQQRASRQRTKVVSLFASCREVPSLVTSLLDRYLSPDGTLRHGSSRRPGDTPLIYGQYFLLEALMTLDGVSK
jgi:hypothetical protein